MRRLLSLVLLALLAGCGGREPVAVPAPAPLTKLAPGTHQQTADVPGVGSVNYTLEIPDGYDGQSPVPLVLVLHYGYDGPRPAPYTGRAMIDAFRPGLSGLKAILLAPDAVGGRWTDAPNEKAAVWLTKSVQQSYAIDPKRILITGFSLGGEGAWFIGSRHPGLFTGAIPVAAPIPRGMADWTMPVYVIHSDKDQVVSYGEAKKHANAIQGKGGKSAFRAANDLSHYDTSAYAPYVGDAVQWLETEWKRQ
jgi:predicted peptidase